MKGPFLEGRGWSWPSNTEHKSLRHWLLCTDHGLQRLHSSGANETQIPVHQSSSPGNEGMCGLGWNWLVGLTVDKSVPEATTNPR